MALGLVLVVLLAELGVRLVEDRLPEPQRWSTPELQYKVAQIDDLGDIDTVVVGSSVVDVSIDPSQLPGSAYNASLGAASMAMVAAFTRGVVAPRLDPDVVVVGVSPRELNANAIEQRRIEEDFFASPAVAELRGTESLLQRADRVAGDALRLVRYRPVLRQPARWIDRGLEWDSSVTDDRGLYLGFLDATYRSSPAVLARLRDDALLDFRVGDAQLGALRDLVRDLRDADRRVVLVIAPVTRDVVRAYPGGEADHRGFRRSVAGLSETLDVALVDAGVWPESLMADPLHTNAAGTDRLTRIVAEAIE